MVARAEEEKRAKEGRLEEQAFVHDRWPEPAPARRPMALRAGARPFALPELGVRAAEPGGILAGRLNVDDGVHLGVEDTAELAALSEIRPDSVRLEPRVGGVPGNRVELAAKLGDPPAVVDVV